MGFAIARPILSRANARQLPMVIKLNRDQQSFLSYPGAGELARPASAVFGSSQHPRHPQQPRPLGIRGLDRLFGAEYHHSAFGSDLRHGIAEIADVGRRGR